MGNEFTLEDIQIILRRRLAYLMVPIIVLIPLLIIGVLLLPARYTAEGIMLIESPQISETLVKGTGATRALERIEVTRQRIRSRPQLLDIADQTALFSQRSRLSETKKVKRMQKRMRVKPITSRFVTNTSGRDTLAFSVAYTDPSPIKAMKVANELINRFEREDSKRTTTETSNTTEFFEREVEEKSADLSQLQDEIASFKAENDGSLPEQLELHSRQLERFIQQLGGLDNQLSSIEEDKRFVESQIASIASGGGSENSPETLLISKKAALGELRSRYTEAHPEVIALRNEIRSLERQLSPGRELQNLQRRVEEAEEKLAQALRDDADPEIISDLEDQVTLYSDQFVRKATNSAGLSSQAQTYILQSRLTSLQNRTRAVGERRERLQARIEDLEARINRTPAVESQLLDLLRDRKFKEDELEKARLRVSQATTSENIQVEGRAERITQVEAAALPEKPSSPNRPALIAVSFLFAGLVGVLTALAREFVNVTIRGRNHLTALLEEPPLAVIPFIEGTETNGFKMPFFSGSPKGGAKSPSAAAKPAAQTTAVQGTMGDDDLGALPAE
ncbi:MAG: hypothetical protein AAGH42_05060 [Pseudomonadota bacterium]